MKTGILIVFLIFTVLFEGAITSVPLVWVALLALVAVRQDESVFFLAFLAGIVLDIFTLHPLGESSSILLVFLFLGLLYKRKYEIRSLPFMSIASAIGGIIFMILTQESNLFFGGFVCLILGGGLFYLINIRNSSQAPMAYPARGIQSAESMRRKAYGPKK